MVGFSLLQYSALEKCTFSAGLLSLLYLNIFDYVFHAATHSPVPREICEASLATAEATFLSVFVHELKAVLFLCTSVGTNNVSPAHRSKAMKKKKTSDEKKKRKH